MTFADELNAVLPSDLPHRETVIVQSARHLELIEKTNQLFNLTRITGVREAAIKHVLDSVLPWAHFGDSRHILDAGTGAGFPGIPLALVLPHVRFTLADSVGKKARFVESAIQELQLENVEVANSRAEDWLKTGRPDTITGRALAPIDRACGLFAGAIRAGSRVILYKGPDVESEISEAAAEARKYRISLRVLDRYELPDGLGTRTLVEMAG